MISFQLFLRFFQIGLLSFGGGYAAMPLIQGQVVQGHGWLSMSEFTDLITISQMTPGPIAVNSATFVGIKIAGIPGAHGRACGSSDCNVWMYSAVVYSRHTACEAIFKIPRNGNAPGNPPLPPPGGCGDDRFRRDFNSGHGVLE